MKHLNEDKLAEIVIDLEELKKNKQVIMKRMFGGSEIPVSVKGNPRDVSAFAKAIGNEKSYIDTAKKHGLHDPRTYKSKSLLKKATNSFERVTGIKWPFK